MLRQVLPSPSSFRSLYLQRPTAHCSLPCQQRKSSTEIQSGRIWGPNAFVPSLLQVSAVGGDLAYEEEQGALVVCFHDANAGTCLPCLVALREALSLVIET